MALDRIRPLKLESPSTGGTQDDAFPTEADHHEDYADLRGIVFQDDASNDELVGCGRDASGNLIFWDDVVSTVKTLSDLLAGGTAFDPNTQIFETSGALVYANNEEIVMKS